MPEGPLGFPRLTSIGPLVEEGKKEPEADPLEQIESPMLRKYVKSLAEKLDRPVEEVVRYRSVRDYAEKLGAELPKVE